MDIAKIRSEFPLFKTNPNLVYLDSAATALTQQGVIDAMHEYYAEYGANIHRGLYNISAKATEKYEEARDIIAEFINAQREEVIFTSGTTAALNMLATSLDIQKGDNIVLTRSEHHANLVPWQQLGV